MTSYRQNNANRVAGFTLVEILVVIAIIGMLAGLTTTVLVSARRSVRNSVVSSLEAQLSMALDEYKNKFGEYPPDFSDDVAVLRHIKKRWPRYNVTSVGDFLDDIRYGCWLSSSDLEFANSLTDLEDAGTYEWDVRRHVSALVFWLGGLPNADGIPSGFYANPKAPLGVQRKSDGSVLPIHKPGRAQREKPLYAFERKDLACVNYTTQSDARDNVYYVVDESEVYDDSLQRYTFTPAFCQGGYPILYFRPSTNMPYADKWFMFGESATDGITMACPYARGNDAAGNLTWYEERRFQLIHPGVDGFYGPLTGRESGRTIPVTQPTNCYLEDNDNITNFLDNGTLESEYKDANGN